MYVSNDCTCVVCSCDAVVPSDSVATEGARAFDRVAVAVWFLSSNSDSAARNCCSQYAVVEEVWAEVANENVGDANAACCNRRCVCVRVAIEHIRACIAAEELSALLSVAKTSCVLLIASVTNASAFYALSLVAANHIFTWVLFARRKCSRGEHSKRERFE